MFIYIIYIYLYQAIADTNAKNFLGRPIAVDWAVPKELFKGTKVGPFQRSSSREQR